MNQPVIPEEPPIEFPDEPPGDFMETDESIFPDGGMVQTAIALGAQPAATPSDNGVKIIPVNDDKQGKPSDAAPRTELSTVLYRPTQFAPNGDVASAHWVSVKISNSGNPADVFANFEALMKKMWSAGYVDHFAKPAQQTFSATAPAVPQQTTQVVAPPNMPTNSPSAANNPPAPTAPPSQPSGGGSADSGVDKLHRIAVNPNGRVEFYVGNFKYPFPDSRYDPNGGKVDPKKVYESQFDPSVGIPLTALQTPQFIDCESANIVAEWERVQKNGKTYYNVVRVRPG